MSAKEIFYSSKVCSWRAVTNQALSTLGRINTFLLNYLLLIHHYNFALLCVKSRDVSLDIIYTN